MQFLFIIIFHKYFKFFTRLKDLLAIMKLKILSCILVMT